MIGIKCVFTLTNSYCAKTWNILPWCAVNGKWTGCSHLYTNERIKEQLWLQFGMQTAKDQTTNRPVRKFCLQQSPCYLKTSEESGRPKKNYLKQMNNGSQEGREDWGIQKYTKLHWKSAAAGLMEQWNQKIFGPVHCHFFMKAVRKEVQLWVSTANCKLCTISLELHFSWRCLVGFSQLL